MLHFVAIDLAKDAENRFSGSEGMVKKVVNDVPEMFLMTISGSIRAKKVEEFLEFSYILPVG